MEGTPTFLDYTDILEVFMQVDGVVRVHNLRLWGLTANKSALSAHLAIGNCLPAHRMLEFSCRKKKFVIY